MEEGRGGWGDGEIISGGHWMRGCEREEDKRKLGVMERERGRKKEGWKKKPESEREAEKRH